MATECGQMFRAERSIKASSSSGPCSARYGRKPSVRSCNVRCGNNESIRMRSWRSITPVRNAGAASFGAELLELVQHFPFGRLGGAEQRGIEFFQRFLVRGQNLPDP